MACNVPGLIEQLLPLLHHSEPSVVQETHYHWDIILDGCGELVRDHLEASVTRDVSDDALRPCELGSDGRGEPEAHCAQSARCNEHALSVALEEVGGPHLILPH